MKQDLTWGAAAALAIAATVGYSSLSTSKPASSNVGGVRPASIAKQPKSKKQSVVHKECSEQLELVQAFLLDDKVAGPAFCYDPDDKTPVSAAAIKSKESLRPSFVIATFPDPLHTHFSLLFDRFVEAIQQAAQDEGYQYDSSWLPWETEEPSLTLLGDQDEADDRKENRENQPGVLLFHRNPRETPQKGQTAREPYQTGLFVFIVGEDSTDGIHRKQFENAVRWIAALHRDSGESPVAILGPTFSGSFPSLTELLADPVIAPTLGSAWTTIHKPLAIYSGSVTGKKDASQFAKNPFGNITSTDDVERFAKDPSVVFHSFVQDDETELDLFCRYLTGNGKKTFDLHRLAILSEDETAYGDDTSLKPLCDGASWLYYPRDISTLRSAYQQQSIFNSAASQQNQSSPQRNNLPTDLADPEGKEHDTVRTYAGNQTPLSQEAELLAVVGVLRSQRSQYIVLRSSNTLDPLFLANFLRRQYPQARVVILNSDLLFQRGQDATQLSGEMTLSTYPLIPAEREWTARPPFPVGSHRVFPESSTQGTYIASRLLLRSPMFGVDSDYPPSCMLSQTAMHEVFLPSVICKETPGKPYLPVPDYAPPFWTETLPCSETMPSESCKPATWLSVITKTGSWPLAALNNTTLPPSGQHQDVRNTVIALPTSEPQASPRWPPTPLSMKVFLVLLGGLSLFHAACCWSASFTAKPAFRAHFATHGWRHRVLILMGTLLIAQMALMTGWGCGIFSWAPGPSMNTGRVRYLVFVIWTVAALSLATNLFVTRRLSEDAANRRKGSHSDARFRLGVIFSVIAFFLLLGVSYFAWVHKIEEALIPANRVFVYWRSMNLTSGVSPIVPFLFLLSGLYICFWYSLHGLALFGPDRPRLPRRAELIITIPNKEQRAKDEELDVLPMFCEECAADPAEQAAVPLAWRPVALTLGLFLFFGFLVIDGVREVPVRSLGAKTYTVIFCLWLDFCFSLVFGAAWQLMQTWSQTRQLLVFLDRMPLRRTLGALRGFSWGTVWRMSGNVLDVRYKLLSRQLECLNHLRASLEGFPSTHPRPDESDLQEARNSLATVEESQKAGIVFAKWYSANYRNPHAAGLKHFEELQKQIATTTGRLLTHLLAPAWRKEKNSLILITTADNSEDERKQPPLPSTYEHIRNAEELVCLTYLGFAQNMLGRIRTIALGALCLFVATTLAVSNYPFDPRPALSAVFLLLFAIFGTVVVSVYADMHRDTTLSHITNKTPGELGSEFWFKIVGFGAAPLIGLIATIFPELSGSLFSWLQPGLTALK